MRKISRIAALVPGGLLAAALVVSGCSSLDGQATPPQTPAGSAGGAASGSAASTNSGTDVDAPIDVVVDLEFAKVQGVWTVAYEKGQIVDSPNSAPYPIGTGEKGQATLASDAQLFSPFGGTGATDGPQVDQEGLGVVPVSLDDFVAQGNQSAKIWINKDKQITRIAARYQP